MSRETVVGIDVGGSGVKAGIVTLTGDIVGVAQSRYKVRFAGAGIAEYEPAVMVREVIGSLRELAARCDASRVAGICVDAMVSGMVPIGDDGQAVGPYTTTVDTRAAVWARKLVAEYGPEVQTVTGSREATLASKIRWVEESYPGVYSRTRRFVTAGSMVTGSLAGLAPEDLVIDRSCLWATGLGNTRTGRWDSGLCDKAGIDVTTLPTIRNSWEVVGGLSRAVAELTGLQSGTPVVAGCADQAAGYAGVGLLSGERAALSMGSYIVVARRLQRPREDDFRQTYKLVSGALPGLWYAQQGIAGGGLVLDWVRGLWGRARGNDGNGARPRLLVDGARSADPGCDGLVFVPAFAGSVGDGEGGMGGAWIGLKFSHGPSELYRAALEGVAAQVVRCLEEVTAAQGYTAVVAYGGGSRETVLNQIVADMSGRVVESVGIAEAGILGSAMVAALGVGIVSDREAIPVEPRLAGIRYVPNRNRAEVYRRVLERQHKAMDVERHT